MNFDPKLSLGDLVAENYRLAAVLSSYGLDFCCHGNRTLKEACDQKGIKFEEVQKSLQTVADEGQGQPLINRFSEWPVSFLVEYIYTNHHVYLHRMLPIVRAGLEKTARVHGERHSELLECSRLFNEISDDLHQHLWKEENVLFPYIKALDGQGKLPWPKVPFDSVATPINAMRTEHEREGGHLFQLRDLSKNYEVPSDGCNTYRATYGQLADLDADLIQHIHLENNILFPRVLALEEATRKK